MADPDTTTHLSQVIGHAIPPAFVLGAISGFIAVLIARFNRIMDRSVSINAIRDDDHARLRLREDLPRLRRRAKLINDSIYLAVASAIVTVLLVMVSFGTAFVHLDHEPGVAILFTAALGLLGASLVYLAREIRIALTDLDHFG